MTRRLFQAPQGTEQSRPQDRTTTLKMLGYGTGFAALAGLLVMFQPGTSPETFLAKANGSADAVVAADEQTVARATLGLIPIETGPAAMRIKALTQETGQDLTDLTASALAQFGHRPVSDDPLLAILVDALANEKSDAYIDALLNRSAAQGEVTVPRLLRDSAGRFDTPRLLDALILQAR